MRAWGLSVTTQQVICSKAETANVLYGTSHLLTVCFSLWSWRRWRRCDQPVPVVQDALDGFQQQVAPEEQEVEAGHHIAHAKDADVGRPNDEDDGEHEPEGVAEDDHHGYVQVRPGQWNQETIQAAAQMK